MAQVLVTGATGFIGYHLVKYLAGCGETVTCLVRPSSDRSRLIPLRPKFMMGDVTDRDSVRRALTGIDVVYHLAGVTKSLRVSELEDVNQLGVRNVATCCAEMGRPPVLVVTSSLAAAGPSSKDMPRTEVDTATPVSAYGRSKRAGELVLMEYASQVPITVVRPPIVFGEGDRDGLAMYEAIANLGVHLVPGFSDEKFSLIHAEDLASALVLSAAHGRRLTNKEEFSEGIYFATADEVVTFAELGRLIGEEIGRPRAWVVRTPLSAVWCIAACSEIVARVRRQPNILNLDKAREATAGSWTCSAAALRHDTGFVPARTLRERIHQTAQWYVLEGWMRKPKRMVIEEHSRTTRSVPDPAPDRLDWMSR